MIHQITSLSVCQRSAPAASSVPTLVLNTSTRRPIQSLDQPLLHPLHPRHFVHILRPPRRVVPWSWFHEYTPSRPESPETVIDTIPQTHPPYLGRHVSPLPSPFPVSPIPRLQGIISAAGGTVELFRVSVRGSWFAGRRLWISSLVRSGGSGA